MEQNNYLKILDSGVKCYVGLVGTQYFIGGNSFGQYIYSSIERHTASKRNDEKSDTPRTQIKN